MARLNFDDFAWSEEGDYILDRDPLDDGSNVGWDIMTASKFSRENRRAELTADNSHPESASGTLRDYYTELLREFYPGVSDLELLDLMHEWNFKPEDEFEALRQLARDRAKTMNPDWTVFPNTGMDMELLIGKDMDVLSSETGRQQIETGLTYDDLLEFDELEVTFHPHDARTLLYLIQMNVGGNFIARVVVPFSFVDGPYLVRKERDINAVPAALHA